MSMMFFILRVIMKWIIVISYSNSTFSEYSRARLNATRHLSAVGSSTGLAHRECSCRGAASTIRPLTRVHRNFSLYKGILYSCFDLCKNIFQVEGDRRKCNSQGSQDPCAAGALPRYVSAQQGRGALQHPRRGRHPLQGPRWSSSVRSGSLSYFSAACGQFPRP